MLESVIIKQVINSVVHNIAQKSIDRLPCKTTLCDMMVECLTVAQAQLGEMLTPDDKDYFTLHTDGTTKYGEHFGTYDVTILMTKRIILAFAMYFQVQHRLLLIPFVKFLRIWTLLVKKFIPVKFRIRLYVN